jgi:hypothetical protein
MVPVAAVRPEAVRVGSGIKMTTEMRVGHLSEGVPAGGCVYCGAFATPRAVEAVAYLEASRILRVDQIKFSSVLRLCSTGALIKRSLSSTANKKT